MYWEPSTRPTTSLIFGGTVAEKHIPCQPEDFGGSIDRISDTSAKNPRSNIVSASSSTSVCIMDNFARGADSVR